MFIIEIVYYWSTCRGGGLITYVNTGVCCADDIEMLDVGHESTQDCEFLFVYFFLVISLCVDITRSEHYYGIVTYGLTCIF